MTASGYPAASNIFLAFFDRYARSPESRRIPYLVGIFPSAFISSNTRIAFGTPDFNVSYVSTNNVHVSGYNSAYLLNAVYSSGKLMIQLCACVPSTGTPNCLPQITFEVPTQPPITAALAPKVPASGPCARRSPNSMIPSPFAA